MEEISCIFCEKSNTRVAITENEYTGLKCDDCELVYISPRPEADEVINVYTHEHATLYADAQLHFEEINSKQAASVLSEIRKHKREGSVLELGPGAGFFLQEARNLGYDVWAIELNPVEAQWIDKLDIPCETEPLNENSFDGQQFDIVYHRDVLSHLSDPVGVFQEINRALKPGGLLVFETGNTGELSEKYYKYFTQFLYPDHLFFFGEKSIRLLLDRTGFKVIEFRRYAIILQLLLSKALWGLKDRLKDVNKKDQAQDGVVSVGSTGSRASFKRRLRSLYRLVSFLLIRIGTAVLPKKGRPLKLLVFATKTSTAA